MKVRRIVFALGVSLLLINSIKAAPSPQEPAFEIPVQLIGFPVIIAAVRLTNFVKKLAYSLNPETYVSRARRSTRTNNRDEEFLDVAEVEKRLVSELGNSVCIYERTCANYASKSVRKHQRDRVMDWDDIFSRYKNSPDRMKENYLLSVFLGDIVASPRLCHQLAKRGRGCDDRTLEQPE